MKDSLLEVLEELFNSHRDCSRLLFLTRKPCEKGSNFTARCEERPTLERSSRKWADLTSMSQTGGKLSNERMETGPTVPRGNITPNLNFYSGPFSITLGPCKMNNPWFLIPSENWSTVMSVFNQGLISLFVACFVPGVFVLKMFECQGVTVGVII
jgi:hypothetical protein